MQLPITKKKKSQKLHTGFEDATLGPTPTPKLNFYFTRVFMYSDQTSAHFEAILGITSVYQTQCDMCGQNSIHK